MRPSPALAVLFSTIACLTACGATPPTPGAAGGGTQPSPDAPAAEIDCSQSNVTFVYQDRSYRLTNTCYNYDEQKIAQGELLYGPDKGTPDMSLYGCGDEVMVSLWGHAPTLPGNLSEPVIKVRMPGDPDERPSTSATIRVTSLGSAGDMIAGKFEGVLSPKLNEPGVPEP